MLYIGLPITRNNPPCKLVLYEPATCVDYNRTTCTTYFIKNIMLGQDIKVKACVLGLYDQSAEGADFLVNGMDDQDLYQLLAVILKAYKY